MLADEAMSEPLSDQDAERIAHRVAVKIAKIIAALVLGWFGVWAVVLLLLYAVRASSPVGLVGGTADWITAPAIALLVILVLGALVGRRLLRRS
jgi:hypothetical protein